MGFLWTLCRTVALSLCRLFGGISVWLWGPPSAFLRDTICSPMGRPKGPTKRWSLLFAVWLLPIPLPRLTSCRGLNTPTTLCPPLLLVCHLSSVFMVTSLPCFLHWRRRYLFPQSRRMSVGAIGPGIGRAPPCSERPLSTSVRLTAVTLLPPRTLQATRCGCPRGIFPFGLPLASSLRGSSDHL